MSWDFTPSFKVALFLTFLLEDDLLLLIESALLNLFVETYEFDVVWILLIRHGDVLFV